MLTVPIQTPFLPDRAGRLPLNMVPQLNEIASFHLQNDTVKQVFDEITSYNLLSVIKAQEIKIFPEFYKHWKSNDNLLIKCQLHSVGTTSYNVQFDIHHETDNTILCQNIRSIVVCDIKMKPHPIPKDSLNYLKSVALHMKRYFVPPAFKTKSNENYETSAIVRPSDMDHYYHVNQSNYLEFMLDAAVSAARSGAYTSLKQDIAFASVDHVIMDYERELCLDENVKIETWEDSEHPMKLCFEMSTGTKLAFKGSILLHEPFLKFSDKIKTNFPRAEEF